MLCVHMFNKYKAKLNYSIESKKRKLLIYTHLQNLHAQMRVIVKAKNKIIIFKTSRENVSVLNMTFTTYYMLSMAWSYRTFALYAW